MSAIAAIVKDDRIHLLSDAAFYDWRDGVLLKIAPKIWPVPGLNAAFMTRGPARAFSAFSDLCAAMEFEAFDQLLAVAPDMFVALGRVMEGEGFEILVAGFSESSGEPVALFYCTNQGYEEIEPGIVYRLGGVSQFGLDGGDFPAASDFEPAVHALPAFEKARRHVEDISCGQAESPVIGHAVGGGVLHIELTTNGCSGGWLHMWEDVVGERIRLETG